MFSNRLAAERALYMNEAEKIVVILFVVFGLLLPISLYNISHFVDKFFCRLLPDYCFPYFLH